MVPADELERDILTYRFTKGDKSAFHSIYKLLGRPLYAFVFTLTEDKPESEDIVTDAFVKLWRQRETFTYYRNVKAYLYIVAKNSSLDYLKHIKRRKASHREIFLLSAKSSDETELHTIYADLLARVFEEAENLPELAKKIFKMTFVEGLKPEEIAKILQMPAQNVRNNKNRAVELLRLALGKKKIL